MSLICGALKWLKDSDERDKIEAEKILKGERRFVHVIHYERHYNMVTLLQLLC